MRIYCTLEGGAVDSGTDYYITLQVRALALLRDVEDYLSKPWSIKRFHRMKQSAEYLRKWAPKK